MISVEPSQFTVVVVMSSTAGRPPKDEDRPAMPISAIAASVAASVAALEDGARLLSARSGNMSKSQGEQPSGRVRGSPRRSYLLASCPRSCPSKEMEGESVDEEVEAWLGRLCDGDGQSAISLPADLHPESRLFLRRLVAASARRDEDELHVALAAQRRAAAHAVELEEVEDTLHQCGLIPRSLPTAVSSSLGATSSRNCSPPCSSSAVNHTARVTRFSALFCLGRYIVVFCCSIRAW